ncbi:cryptochrome/photolyase family protein [Streptomyces sp. NPDC059752]|uniref:cryptochrome/photolyase family protein n=1 Tax=unclassified Streptomyces TaxID=2593676 RepID=UPI0036614543
MSPVHWLFGDQLGPHFTATAAGGTPRNTRWLLIESRAVFRRRRFHRAKAHLILSAMRHRAADLGAGAQYVTAETYREGLVRTVGDAPVSVHHPTSRAALALVASLPQVTVHPARGFLVGHREFADWAARQQGRRLLQENLYEHTRRSHDILMDGDRPAGGRWNLDHDNREPPPRGRDTLGAPPPYRPREDEIDEGVRRDLDRWEREEGIAFVGRDGPRLFPASRREALAALDHFVAHRLAGFGAHEDAMLAGDPVMSHSLLSSSLNLGLLDPWECVTRAEAAWRAGVVPLSSAEGFIRQVCGWREYVWGLYWHLGEDYRHRNDLRHTAPVPAWFAELDADAPAARCLSTVLAQVRDTGWTHHIPRLMVLGSHALQRGWDPAQVTDWFHRCFVDGYDWVMLPNVVGMSQYADGGLMTTKPYTSGGAYIHRMSDLCGGCRYRPADRTGERACPYTVGYWAFLDRHRSRLEGNPRMARAVRGLDRLGDAARVARAHRAAGDAPP